LHVYQELWDGPPVPLLSRLQADPPTPSFSVVLAEQSNPLGADDCRLSVLFPVADEEVLVRTISGGSNTVQSRLTRDAAGIDWFWRGKASLPNGDVDERTIEAVVNGELVTVGTFEANAEGYSPSIAVIPGVGHTGAVPGCYFLLHNVENIPPA